MSASDGVWVRRIGDKFYVRYGHDGVLGLEHEDLDQWFKEQPDAVADNRGDALVAAHDKAAQIGNPEYGVAEV